MELQTDFKKKDEELVADEGWIQHHNKYGVLTTHKQIADETSQQKQRHTHQTK